MAEERRQAVSESEDRQAELDRALDQGALDELPPNHVKGWLGEVSPDLRKPDDWSPDLNAGLSQEDDLPVMWLAVLVAYLLFFPLAYLILWRSRVFSARTKIVASCVGAAGIVAVAWWLLIT